MVDDPLIPRLKIAESMSMPFPLNGSNFWDFADHFQQFLEALPLHTKLTARVYINFLGSNIRVDFERLEYQKDYDSRCKKLYEEARISNERLSRKRQKAKDKRYAEYQKLRKEFGNE